MLEEFELEFEELLLEEFELEFEELLLEEFELEFEELLLEEFELEFEELLLEEFEELLLHELDQPRRIRFGRFILRLTRCATAIACPASDVDAWLAPTAFFKPSG